MFFVVPWPQFSVLANHLHGQSPKYHDTPLYRQVIGEIGIFDWQQQCQICSLTSLFSSAASSESAGVHGVSI